MKKTPISKQIPTIQHWSDKNVFYASYFFKELPKSLELRGDELNKFALEATGEDWETLSKGRLSVMDALLIVIHYEQLIENRREAEAIVGGWDKATDSLIDKSK